MRAVAAGVQVYDRDGGRASWPRAAERFSSVLLRGGHGPHDLVAMGEQKLTAIMGAEFIMETVMGEQRLQPVRPAPGPATTRRATQRTRKRAERVRLAPRTARQAIDAHNGGRHGAGRQPLRGRGQARQQLRSRP